MTEDDHEDTEAEGDTKPDEDTAADTDEDPFADTDDDPFADIDEEEAEEGASEADPFTDIDGIELEDDPFTDLSVGGTGDPSTDFGPSDNTLFTDEGATELDDEAVWDRIEGDGEDGIEAETTPELDPETGPEPTASSDDGGVETVVKKGTYCEKCEHFSDPPDVSCTYPNSEIVELIDTGHFRVRNCPVVARRRSSDISSIAEGGGTTAPELEADDRTGPEPEVDEADGNADD